MSKNLLRLVNLRNALFRRQAHNGHDSAHHQSQSSSSLSGFLSRFLIKEHPHYHRGYIYRESGNLQGATSANFAHGIITFTWAFIFYNLYYNSQNFLGHMTYPDTSKWTDKELGITDEE
jgi:hypothetical protein